MIVGLKRVRKKDLEFKTTSEPHGKFYASLGNAKTCLKKKKKVKQNTNEGKQAFIFYESQYLILFSSPLRDFLIFN